MVMVMNGNLIKLQIRISFIGMFSILMVATRIFARTGKSITVRTIFEG